LGGGSVTGQPYLGQGGTKLIFFHETLGKWETECECVMFLGG